MIQKFLYLHPYLKPVHINNLFNRLLALSNNTLMVVYNNFRDTYEVHSIKSFKYTGDSLNAVIEEDMLNGWLLTDIKANDVAKFGTDIQSERELNNSTLELYENRGLDLLTIRALKTVETVVGREI